MTEFNPGGASTLNQAVKQRYEANADTNAFSDAEKAKLAGAAVGATANAADAALRDRATHTGTQVAATISDFAAAVAATAAVTANTAKVTNQTHTGDVTGSGALTIADNATTYAKMQDVSAASRLLGRGSASGAGDPQELTIGGGLTLTGTTLAAVANVVGPASATDNAVARFDLATGKLLQNSGVTIADDGALTLPSVAAPAAPPASTVTLFGRDIAGRMLPAYAAPSGIDSALQPLLARNKVGYWNPNGNNSSAPGIFGFPTVVFTGFTNTTRNVATTNHFTRYRRLGFVTAATAGEVGHWRTNRNQFTIGDGAGVGGFTYIIRFGISDAAAVSGARMFMGMAISSVTPTNVEPNTLVNCIGMGHGAADTNMKLFYGGSAAQTPIDLGVNFPSNTLDTDMYELALFASPQTQTIGYLVTRLNTGHTASGTLSGTVGTVVPSSTELLGPWGYRTNNATALAVGLDVASAYIETDF